MSSSDMTVFNEYIMPVIAQQLPQRIAAFNEAAPGIVLSSAGFVGDFFEQSFYNALHSSRRRVDAYAAQATQAPVDLSQGQHNTVKVHGGFGPIRFEPKQFAILQKPTQEGVTVIANQFVDAFIQDQLNTSVSSCYAAVFNNAGTLYDESTGNVATNPAASLNQRGLNKAHALYGDMSQQLVTQIMTGNGYHSLIDEAIENSTRLFTSSNVTVIDILGKRSVVSDIPALVDTTKESVLILSNGGVMVDSGEMPITNIDTRNGQTRIETTWQTDYEFSIGLKGYSWDETNGGRSPSDAALATGTNWDKVANDDKFTAGVIYKADSAL
jgi:hypothetical protein